MPLSTQPPAHTTEAKPSSTPLTPPRHPSTATLLVDVHSIVFGQPAHTPLPRTLLIVRLHHHLKRSLLFPPQDLPLQGPLLDFGDLRLQFDKCRVALLRPGLERGLQRGEDPGGQVSQRRDRRHVDKRVSRVQRCGQQPRVNGCSDEFFEGARRGQVQGSRQRIVRQGRVGVGEWQQREEEEFLALLGGELWQRAMC